MSEVIDTTKSPLATEQIKLIGILHFVGNIFSGGILGTLLVIGYLLIVKDLTPEAKIVIYDIINFNVSYLIYMIISMVLMIILIGFLLLGIGAILWFVILIIGFIKHLSGDRYKYPLAITFLK